MIFGKGAEEGGVFAGSGFEGGDGIREGGDCATSTEGVDEGLVANFSPSVRLSRRGVGDEHHIIKHPRNIVLITTHEIIIDDVDFS